MKYTATKPSIFEKLSSAVARWTGTTMAFIIAISVIVIWLVTGPVFEYSDTWQLIINTSTTIITFLMVFLIQRSQNKEAVAIQVKLNELIASSEKASNRLIDVEDLNEDELKALQSFFHELVKMSKKDKLLNQSHSVDEAIALHKRKLKRIRNTDL